MYTIYTSKTAGGVRKYLVSGAEALNLVDDLSKAQSKRGIFYNISIKPYTGNKYPFGAVWVCEG